MEVLIEATTAKSQDLLEAEVIATAINTIVGKLSGDFHPSQIGVELSLLTMNATEVLVVFDI